MMRRSPLFTIVMPAYNAARTIGDTIASVRAQTCPDWRLLVVDDGSTDETLTILDALTLADDRILVHRQPNSGPSAARNRGLRDADTPFIAFLDSDDLWHPDRLAGMVEAFERRMECGVLFSRTRFLSGDGTRLGVTTRHVARLDLADLLAENATCSTSNIVCRRQVVDTVGLFDEALSFAEDQDWLVRAAMAGNWTIEGVNAVWFYYRSSPDSLSSDLHALCAGWRTLVERARLRDPDQVAQAERRATGIYYRQLSRRALRIGSRASEAALWFVRALRSDPFLPFAQPRRTILTAAGVALAFAPIAALKDAVRK